MTAVKAFLSELMTVQTLRTEWHRHGQAGSIWADGSVRSVASSFQSPSMGSLSDGCEG